VLSDIINAIRAARLEDKADVSLVGVSPSGENLKLPYPHAGWINVADAQYTSGSPISIASGVKTQITIDGLGAATNTAYADGMPSDVWSGNKFRPSGLGEAYNLRITCTVTQTTSGTGNFVTFDADIGTDETPFLSASQSVPLIKGQGNATLITIAAPFFTLDTFGRNGARLFLTPSVDITAHSFAIFIQRTFQP
jgi:hypothetical protein